MIRKATVADVDLLVKQMQKFEKEKKRVARAVTTSGSNIHTIVEMYVRDKDKIVFIINDTEQDIVGYLMGHTMMQFPDDKKPKMAKVEEIYVDPSARHRGHAKLLLQQFYLWAKSQGISKILTEALTANLASNRFWRHCKFKELRKLFELKI